jgi:hypothetical protein
MNHRTQKNLLQMKSTLADKCYDYSGLASWTGMDTVSPDRIPLGSADS